MKTKVISDQSRLANLKMLSIKEAALCAGVPNARFGVWWRTASCDR
jgi:hypothetical protein